MLREQISYRVTCTIVYNRQKLGGPDYHLFPGLKNQLKIRHFSFDAEVIAAAETWLDGQFSEFFLKWLTKVRARAKKSIELRGECKSRVCSL